MCNKANPFPLLHRAARWDQRCGAAPVASGPHSPHARSSTRATPPRASCAHGCAARERWRGQRCRARCAPPVSQPRGRRPSEARASALQPGGCVDAPGAALSARAEQRERRFGRAQAAPHACACPVRRARTRCALFAARPPRLCQHCQLRASTPQDALLFARTARARSNSSDRGVPFHPQTCAFSTRCRVTNCLAPSWWAWRSRLTCGISGAAPRKQ